MTGISGILRERVAVDDHAATDAAESARWNNTLRWFEDALTSGDKMVILLRGWRNMESADRLAMLRDYIPDEFADIQRDAEA